MYSETGQSRSHGLLLGAALVKTVLGRVTPALVRRPRRPFVAALVAVSACLGQGAIPGLALAQTDPPADSTSQFSGVTPVWSDNQDGRAHLFLGPEPDYGSSLSAEYRVGDGPVQTLARGDVDGIPSTVRVTEALGAGEHDLSWRWVVDGVAQNWSGADSVKVTNRPLAKISVIDPFGDGRIEMTLDGQYEVGQFIDGEWYVVAPKGVTVTRSTPATTNKDGNLRNGASVDLEFKAQGLDSRNAEKVGFDQSRVYDHKSQIEPGSVLVKVESQPEGKRNSQIRHMATLTVLSERPPAGSFRPTVFENGGRELRNMAEIDLGRVPRINYAPNGFPRLDQIREWRTGQLMRPAPPLAGGSAGARHMYPDQQSSSYHRTQRQDLTLPAHLIMASNLTDETERMALAVSLIQREIDILGAYASKRATGAGGAHPYHWVTPTVFAGTLLRDPKMRGADALGLAPGDYNFDLQGRWKYTSWDDHESFAALPETERDELRRPYRDLNKAGHDMTRDGVQVWAPVLEERRVKLPNMRREDAEDLIALGITYNGDGTWTIPAGRYTDGGLYQWTIHRGTKGETRLLDPDWERNTGSGAWNGHKNQSGKSDAYVAQHSVQAVTMAPLLKAVAGEDYLANGTSVSGATAWDLYSGYALQWMRQSPEVMAALGFNLQKSYPYQRGDATTAGTNDQRGFSTDFIDTGYFERWHAFAPVFEPTAPDPATRQMFSLFEGDGFFEFRLDDVPHDGWSRITDIEIRIDDGDWISTGLTRIGQTYTHDLETAASLVAMRAVNAIGAGAASGSKSVYGSRTEPSPGGMPPGNPGGAPGGNPGRPTIPDRNPSVPDLPGGGGVDLPPGLETTVVPLPPALPLLLAGLGALGAVQYRRRGRVPGGAGRG